MCTLHAGGKFDSKVYETSGGLHGVGVSVANALSERMEVEVAREQKLYRMAFERGKPKGKLEKLGRVPNRRGTRVRFQPDPQIFGAKRAFKPERVFKMARSKAYLFGGVEIRWSCAKELLARRRRTCRRRRRSISPTASRIISPQPCTAQPWCIPTSSPASVGKTGAHGAVEWAVAWTADADGFLSLLLQHHPDAGRRHARVRPAQRADARPQGPRRARRARASAPPPSPATT